MPPFGYTKNAERRRHVARIRRLLVRLLPWSIALVGLWWVGHVVSLHEVIAGLRSLSPLQLALLFLANAIVVLLLPARWYLLLRAQGYRLPYLALARYRLAAFGLSYLTPGPQFGGEPLQIVLVERHHAVPRPVALAAVALDKALELFVNFGFLLLGALVVVRTGLVPGLNGARLLLVSGLLFALPLLYLALLTRGFRPLAALLAPAGRLTGRWQPSLVAALHKTHAAETRAARLPPAALLLAFLLSLATWLALIAEFWLMFTLLGLPLTPLQLALLLTATRLGLLMPLPGGLGTLEAGLLLALELQGLPTATGLSAVLLIRARDLLLALTGLWSAGGFRLLRPRALS